MSYPLSCPSDIEVLIHCHVVGVPHPRSAAPAVTKALERFAERGLIVANPPNGYATTDMGDALVSMLLSTPEPRQAWVDPRTGEMVNNA